MLLVIIWRLRLVLGGFVPVGRVGLGGRVGVGVGEGLGAVFGGRVGLLGGLFRVVIFSFSAFPS